MVRYNLCLPALREEIHAPGGDIVQTVDYEDDESKEIAHER